MLTLSKLTITGFKSFLNRTELVFNSGITAVLGPNGCGKSNISDAVNWVLGEQSAKSLRGDRMTDVIFQGTGSRKPTGMAEVVLSFIKSETSGNEDPLTVSRKVYRDGRNEYILNGRKCRLKDIHEILMEEGLGKDVYSIIEQGRIEQIISSRPYERRLFIEEVAGVRKYREKKKEAVLKLERASENLLRVNDIIEELGNRISTLKRQASRAKRFRELQSELRELKASFYFCRSEQLAALLETSGAELTAASETDAASASKLSVIEGEITSEQHSFDTLSDGAAKQRESLHCVSAEIDRCESEIRFAGEKIATLNEKSAESSAETSRLEELLSLSGKEKNTLLKEKERLERELAAQSEKVSGLDEKFRADEEMFVRLEKELDVARDALIAAMSSETDIKNRISYFDDRMEGLAALLKRYKNESEGISVSLSALGEEMKSIAAGIKLNIKSAGSIRQTLKKTEEASSKLDGDLKSLRGLSVSAGDALKDARRRYEHLAAFVRSKEMLTGGVRLLLDGADLPVSETVADHIESEKGFELAAEAFLGNVLGAAVTDDPENVPAIYAYLEMKKENACPVFVPGHGQKKKKAVPKESLGRLADFLKARDKTGEKILASLPDAAVAENLESALAMFSGNPGWNIVTLDGLVIESGGLFRSVSRETPGILRARAEMDGLEQKSAHLEKELDGIMNRISATESESDRISSEKAELIRRNADLEKEGFSLSMKKEELERRMTTLESNLETLSLESEQTASDMEQLKKEKRELQFRLDEQVEKTAEGAARVEKMKQQLTFAKDLYRERSFSLSEAKARHAEINGLLESCWLELKNYTASSGERTERKNRLAAEIKRNADETEALKKRIAELETAMAELLQKREAENGSLSSVLKELEEMKASVEEKKKVFRDAQKEYNAGREIMTRLEIRVAGLRSDMSNLEERCAEELHVPLREIAGARIERDVEDIALKIRECQVKIDNLGGINLMAIEEYEELQERYEFLDNQRKDLTGSIASIKETIENIRATAAERFNETITAVNSNFSNIFADLFAGGKAELVLEEGSEPDEAGVDIIAQPSGKKLQNIQLLSGGEKALTAIALLFGIFDYRPSPFCLLDEVDAALDEANIDRFTKMLVEKSKNTQFICITHNKRTMSIADTLYGVTMEEPGISKIISASFN